MQGVATKVIEVRSSAKGSVSLDCDAVSTVAPKVKWYRKDWVVAEGADGGEEVPLKPGRLLSLKRVGC